MEHRLEGVKDGCRGLVRRPAVMLENRTEAWNGEEATGVANT